MKNLQSIVMNLILKDEGYRSEEDDPRVVRFYENANLETQETIDTIFISLTGFSLGTILQLNGDDKKSKDLKQMIIKYLDEGFTTTKKE